MSEWIDENKLLTENVSLLYGALKKSHIYAGSPDFEDYLQIARISFCEAYQKYPEVVTNENLYSFKGFAFQRVYWKLIDAQRQNGRRQNNETSLNEAGLALLELPNDQNFQNDLEMKIYLEHLLPNLTEEENLFLKEVYQNDLTISQVALKYQVSRKTIYRWRRNLAAKIMAYDPENYPD